MVISLLYLCKNDWLELEPDSYLLVTENFTSHTISILGISTTELIAKKQKKSEQK
jgi:hypothetical protein